MNGELRFTADRLEATKVRAVLMGAPLTVDVATGGDGLVTIKVACTAGVRELRQHFGHPVFEYFSGSTPWSGTAQIRKRHVEVRLESSLKGIASSLPAPFNKSATEARMLAIEPKPMLVATAQPLREQWLLTEKTQTLYLRAMATWSH